MVRYVFAIFNMYISTMADGRGYLMEDVMVGYIIAIVNVYISELARRCQGPSLADLSSTFPPPLVRLYFSRSRGLFLSTRGGISRLTHHQFRPPYSHKQTTSSTTPSTHPSIPQRRSTMRYQGPHAPPISVRNDHAQPL